MYLNFRPTFSTGQSRRKSHLNIISNNPPHLDLLHWGPSARAHQADWLLPTPRLKFHKLIWVAQSMRLHVSLVICKSQLPNMFRGGQCGASDLETKLKRNAERSTRKFGNKNWRGRHLYFAALRPHQESLLRFDSYN